MRNAFPFLVLFALAACTPPAATGAGTPDVLTLLAVGLAVGALLMFLVSRLLRKAAVPVQRESSHTIVEGVRRVFKVVFAEGQFNEIYTFEETKKLLGFLPTTKKALVIIQAKVLVGYDFAGCVWETDEPSRTLRLVKFPSPQILSIEPDYKYYNFDENIFNLMGGADLNRIQTAGKKQVEQAALQSHLPQIAADQMSLLLTEVVHGRGWKLEGAEKVKGALPEGVGS